MWRKSILLLFTLTALGAECGDKTLNKIQVVFRHGIRYPAHIAWNSSCAQSYNSNQLGNLTESGKAQMRMLGEYLRARYGTLIGQDSTVVKAIYSDYYRDLESASYVYEGLFQNINTSEVNLEKLSKEEDGPLFSNKSYIPTWAETIPWPENVLLLCYALDTINGIKCKGMLDLLLIGDQLKSEVAEGCSLPSWLDVNMQEKLLNFLSAFLQSTRVCVNKNLVHDNSDAFVRNLTYIFHPNVQSKMVHLYALHDINVELLLNRMGIPFLGCPEFGAALIFEQHKIFGKWVVRVFYDNSINYTSFARLKLKGCKEDCNYKDFTRIITGPVQCYDNFPWTRQLPSSAEVYSGSCFLALTGMCVNVFRMFSRP